MATKLKQAWEYVQDLLDVRGDVIMLAFSAAVIARIALAAFSRFPALSSSEAAAYSAAIAAFAYSNKGPKQS